MISFYKNKKGFTLIELLVVISIISLLSSVIMVQVNEARKKAKQARMISDMIQARNAVELYRSDNGSYPNLQSAGLFSVDLVPKYLPVVPTNPFGNFVGLGYIYLKLEDNGDCTLICYTKVKCGEDYEYGRLFAYVPLPGISLPNMKKLYTRVNNDTNGLWSISADSYCID